MISHLQRERARLKRFRCKAEPQRRAAGLCVKCGKEPAAAGRARGPDCLRLARAGSKKRRRALRKSRQCRDCRQPAGGAVRCGGCAKAHAAKATARRLKLKDGQV